MTALRFGIGVDTARFGHHVSFLDQDKRSAAKPFNFNEDRNGYEKLLKAIQALRKKSQDAWLFIRIDAAGLYADNLLKWLYQLQLPKTSISVGKPSANKAYCDVHYDKRKADPVESLACARFAVVEQPEPAKPTPPEFSAVRNAVAALEAIATDTTRQINQLHGLLAQAFPELAVHIKDISNVRCLMLLEQYPTAKKVAAARLQNIEGIPRMTKEMAKTLHVAAKSSTASATDEVQEALIQAKVEDILACKNRKATMLKVLKKAWKALPDGPHRRIETIKGIGLQTAAALVAKMVSIDRFESDSSVVGYFGVFPHQHDSGVTPTGKAKSNSNGKMCKKGNDLVRRLLYTAAQSAVKHNPAVRALFGRQMQLGTGKRPPLNYTLFKSQLDIMQVLRSKGWTERTRRGNQLRGHCPIHNQNASPEDPNFAVHASKQTFCCHKCKCQGNALGLRQALSGLPIHEAAWQWIEQTDMDPPLL